MSRLVRDRPARNGLNLGGVTRPYDDPRQIVQGRGVQPMHRRDDSVGYMRKDERGELLTQAHCRRHYVMQSQSDLFAGKLARCVTEGCRWR